MLDLSSTDFNFAITSVDSATLETLSNSLFDEWEIYVEQALTLPDYSLFLQVEEGSIIGRGKIMTGAKALIIGVTAYGGLMSGIDIITKQTKSTASFLGEQAQSVFGCPKSDANVIKRGGVPAALNRLFARVEKGELTPDEATILARSVLGGEEEELPGFFDALAKAFHDCPSRPEQEKLPFSDLDEELEVLKPEERKGPSKPRRQPPEVPSLHYRVEIWRESKNNKKQSKVTTL
jgi:hypothetical protein